MLVLTGQALVYYVQSHETMHARMKVPVIITNLVSVFWFIVIQIYRFSDAGQACSGDYHLYGESIDFPLKALGHFIDFDRSDEATAPGVDPHTIAVLNEIKTIEVKARPEQFSGYLYGQGNWFFIYIML